MHSTKSTLGSGRSGDLEGYLLQEILSNLMEVTNATKQIEEKHRTLCTQLNVIKEHRKFAEGAEENPTAGRAENPPDGKRTKEAVGQQPSNYIVAHSQQANFSYRAQSIQDQLNLKKDFLDSLRHRHQQQQLLQEQEEQLKRIQQEQQLQKQQLQRLQEQVVPQQLSLAQEPDAYAPCVIQDATVPFVVLRPVIINTFPGWTCIPVAANHAAHLLCGYSKEELPLCHDEVMPGDEESVNMNLKTKVRLIQHFTKSNTPMSPVITGIMRLRRKDQKVIELVVKHQVFYNEEGAPSFVMASLEEAKLVAVGPLPSQPILGRWKSIEDYLREEEQKKHQTGKREREEGVQADIQTQATTLGEVEAKKEAIAKRRKIERAEEEEEEDADAMMGWGDLSVGLGAEEEENQDLTSTWQGRQLQQGTLPSTATAVTRTTTAAEFYPDTLLLTGLEQEQADEGIANLFFDPSYFEYAEASPVQQQQQQQPNTPFDPFSNNDFSWQN